MTTTYLYLLVLHMDLHKGPAPHRDLGLDE